MLVRRFGQRRPLTAATQNAVPTQTPDVQARHEARAIVNGSRQPSRRSPAFTLVELLTVIALIAILAALLLPALSRAEARAIEAKCAANLRSWGQAFYIYASDHNGCLPHTDDAGRNEPPFTFDPRHPEHECGYVDVLPPAMGLRSWREFPGGQKPAGGVWQCPSARPLPDSAYSSSFKPSAQGWHSYAMNSYLAHAFPYGLPFGASPQPSFLKLERCTRLPKTILMFEQTLDPRQGYGQAGGLDTAGRYTAEDPRALGERHPRRRAVLAGNVLYLDGHVGWRGDLWDRSRANPRIPKRGDPTWFPYDY